MLSMPALGHGQQVAVVGGGGFYGRYLVADLLRFTGARVVVVSRAAPRRVRRGERILPVACDLHDPAALATAVRGCAVVVHCAGPFQRLPLGPLHAAITVGAHYVDIAEDHEFRRLVLASHDDALLKQHCTRIIRLDHGRVVSDTPLAR